MDHPLALMILTRDPTGHLSGRKNVLNTAASSLEALNYRVEAVVLGREPTSQTWFGRTLHHVALPSIPRVAVAAARSMITRRPSFNELLFDHRSSRASVRRISVDRGAAVVIADGLRTSALAVHTQLPTILHLDDLLSDRYHQMLASQSGSQDLLGFFETRIPVWLRPMARHVARTLLSREARRTRLREVEAARNADVVATTSSADAQILATRSGRTVLALPMAVAHRANGDPRRADPVSFVFLGGMNYGPNREAIEWWRHEVRAELDRRGGADVVLTVIGECPRRVREQLTDDRLTFRDYVEDLGSELARYRGMVSPVRSGLGVKTKVLDAFSVALPVVATHEGASGVGAVPGRDFLQADHAEDFARAVLLLRDEPDVAHTIGLAGQSLLVSAWTPAAMTKRWEQALQYLATRCPSQFVPAVPAGRPGTLTP